MYGDSAAELIPVGQNTTALCQWPIRSRLVREEVVGDCGSSVAHPEAVDSILINKRSIYIVVVRHRFSNSSSQCLASTKILSPGPRDSMRIIHSVRKLYKSSCSPIRFCFRSEDVATKFESRSNFENQSLSRLPALIGSLPRWSWNFVCTGLKSLPRI